MFPKLLQIDNFRIPTYGVTFALALIVALGISVRNSRRQGLDPNQVRTFGILVAFGAILGAKIFFLLNNWSFYSAHPRQLFSLATLQAGGVFSGGILGALIPAACYARWNFRFVLTVFDASAPGIALAHAVGRIGCFAAGCCWGKPTQALWGVTFRDPLAREWAGTPLGIPLVPTQLLESAVEFANFFLLTWLLQRRKFDGQVIGAYLFLYGLARYGIEYLRDDPGRGSVLGGAMSGTQLISLLLVLTGVLLWLRPAPSVSSADRSLQ